MSVFRINEAHYWKFRRRFLSISLPIAAVIVIGIMLTAQFQTNKVDTSWPIIYVCLELFQLFFLMLCSSFVIYRILRRVRRMMTSYSVTISNSGIMRDQWYTYPISISSTEIKEIVKTRKGGFLVRGQSRKDIITIPPVVNDISELEQQLETLAPITTNTKLVRYLNYQLLGLLAAIVLFFSLLAMENKIAEAISDILIAGFLGWLLYKIQTSRDVSGDEKVLRWVIVIAIVVIVIKACAKLATII
jgi:hypothetical protein